MNFELLRENLDFLREFDEANLKALKAKLNAYESLFHSFGKVHNISHFKALEKELVDSLKILDFKDLNGFKNAVDIGSGAGFPALFLAFVLKTNFTLFEPNAKKAAFLMLVKSELGLENVSVVKEKIERFKLKFKAQLITSRALMSAPELVGLCDGFFDENTLFLLYKGSKVYDELKGFAKYEITEFDKRKYVLINAKNLSKSHLNENA